MSSIKIHQDVYNFERRRFYLTMRQWAAIGGGGAVAVATAALTGYALRMPLEVSVALSLCLAAPVAVAGLVPVRGMRAEDFLTRFLEAQQRGAVLAWHAESIEPMRGEVTRVYSRQKRKPRFERRSHAGLEEPQGPRKDPERPFHSPRNAR